MNVLFPILETYRSNLDFDSLSTERKSTLSPLICYIQEKTGHGLCPNLNFICTHNSRRSQFSQVWAQTAAHYYGAKALCLSGGIEVTAFNERAIMALHRAGFQIKARDKEAENPEYHIRFSETGALTAFSKLFDDPINNTAHFAAVMTCAHAEENCPFIPGSEQRIALRYEDPKIFDGLPEESAMYDERCLQIATEMFYVFSQAITDTET